MTELLVSFFLGESVGNDPFKIDVWSLGVILYALTHGKLPFERPAKEVCERLERVGPDFKADASPPLRSLIRRMLTPKVRKRCSMDDNQTFLHEQETAVSHPGWRPKSTSGWTEATVTTFRHNRPSRIFHITLQVGGKRLGGLP
ncbi:hypothetical protein Pmar_PMAR026035 [Perkinsus marinus ATCC 50983]|uniref:Protein kinase domain-containing protein n=1 Tax=Perkinsus marinus (strain ATCC 50983 / TXsc) TaxID=423536 RepID=C5LK89_PERM5|nr:hypothetical protein Pmar_PMAR026035 [Perkinsus marinus ATCC 50983]EER02876.1 hypothetical protein Pmar_PMAR026035 [Perkinsus marinus ATCC 50983]|eukprot:XP_002771060.1 hypothetical protein Pmar_PMAR026035 [Perkinsus marinus ATCC 50983]